MEGASRLMDVMADSLRSVGFYPGNNSDLREEKNIISNYVPLRTFGVDYVFVLCVHAYIAAHTAPCVQYIHTSCVHILHYDNFR